MMMLLAAQRACTAGGFDQDFGPVLREYCIDCHSGDDANGDVNFDQSNPSDDWIASRYELWESVAGHLKSRTMPPDDSPQPSDTERNRALAWYDSFVDSIDARPAKFRPRRLSVIEYQNTLRSILGFELVTAVIEADQTDSERSLVKKLLPTDPPGQSGFTNDTHANPLTVTGWDAYTYLADVGLNQLFSDERSAELHRFTGPIDRQTGITNKQAKQLVKTFLTLALRRRVSEQRLERSLRQLQGLRGSELQDAVRFELKTALMSPAFLYRGMLAHGKPSTLGQQQSQVDAYELAERMSYFLWADMPDDQLMTLAANKSLNDPKVLTQQVDRMLMSPKARSLTEVFVSQWLTISEIDLVSNNPPIRDALKTQPIDFMNYLFTSDRPLMEMIDSQVTFINQHTSRMYPGDAKQLVRQPRTKGIEIRAMPNQRISIERSSERGGLLTMPGILAMNRGPVLRGTWILERILGTHLPDPPANIGQVKENKKGENLTFRQRFEQHRSKQTCAVCHDKIDPLGFALQSFDSSGQYMLTSGYQSKRKNRKASSKSVDIDRIDTSGRLPSGETFENASELKQILMTTRRESVIRNVVERVMSYSLCRKLELIDRPTIDSITESMIRDDGTWRDLFQAVAASMPFREAIFSGDSVAIRSSHHSTLDRLDFPASVRSGIQTANVQRGN